MAARENRAPASSGLRTTVRAMRDSLREANRSFPPGTGSWAPARVLDRYRRPPTFLFRGPHLCECVSVGR